MSFSNTKIWSARNVVAPFESLICLSGIDLSFAVENFTPKLAEGLD